MTCEKCGEKISVGEGYVLTPNGEIFHDECLEQMDAQEIADLLCAIYVPCYTGSPLPSETPIIKMAITPYSIAAAEPTATSESIFGARWNSALKPLK